MSKSEDTALDERASIIRNIFKNAADEARNEEGIKPNWFSFVRARATRHVTDRVQGPSLEIMNHYEQTSIRALLAWAANEHHAAPETVQAVTEVRFGVDHVEQLPRRDYDEVVRFLIDLRIDEMKN